MSSLVKKEEVQKFFKKYIKKNKCMCKTQAQVKACRLNCDNDEFHKINYDQKASS